MFAGWRLYVHFQVGSWITWWWAKTKDAWMAYETAQIWTEHYVEKWESGDLDLPLASLSGLIALYFIWPLMPRVFTQEEDDGSAAEWDIMSDCGDDGDAGHDLGSSDEVQVPPPKKQQEEKPSPAVESMLAQMQAMMEKMSQLEGNFNARVTAQAMALAAQSQAVVPFVSAQAAPAPTPVHGFSMDDPKMKNAVDKLLERLKSHETTIDLDRGRDTGLAEPTTPTKRTGFSPETTPSGKSEKSGSETIQLSVDEFRKGMVSPKDHLLSHLENYSDQVDWQLPQNLTARVAAPLFMKIFSMYTSCVEYIKAFVKEKELTGNHIEGELMLLAMAIDSMVKSDANFINCEAAEILARRLYGIRRAFAQVHARADWQQPKGQQANKWKSKVNWALCREIDLKSLKDDLETIESVEMEVKKRLEQKALFNKWLQKSEESAGHSSTTE